MKLPKTKSEIIFFKSNIRKTQWLSNFAPSRVSFTETWDDNGMPSKIRKYPSIEHAFQAMTKLKRKEWDKLAVGGRFASWDGFISYCVEIGYNMSQLPKNQLVGWIAKFVTHPKRMGIFGLSPRRKTFSRKQTDGLMSTLLRSKFRHGSAYGMCT